jgi:hypothetical protein
VVGRGFDALPDDLSTSERVLVPVHHTSNIGNHVGIRVLPAHYGLAICNLHCHFY